MNIKIRQAIYGEKNNAHQLLAHTGQPAPIYEEIKRFTDLPMQLPQGTEWEPYLTGLPYNDIYLLCKTFPDPSANRRGMVHTHVLLADLEQLILVNNLDPILHLLPRILDKGNSIGTVELELEKASTPNVTDPGQFLGVARQLLEDGSDSLPVLWAGPNSFLQLISTIWANATPSIRKEFSFGTSFVPDDLRDRDFTVVNAIVSNERKWSSRKLIGATTDSAAIAAEAFVLGLQGGAPIEELITRLGIDEVRSFRQLRLMSSLSAYLQKIDAGSTVSISELLSVLRLLEALSPSELHAGDLKKSAASTLSGRLADSSANELIRMRNMSLNAFRTSRVLIRNALVTWIKSFSAGDASARASAVQVIRSVIADSAGILLESVREFLSDGSNSPSLAKLTWELWLGDDENFKAVSELIPKMVQLENDFVASTPTNLNKDLAEKLVAWSLERKWFALHFSICWAYLSPREAIEKQNSITNQKFKRSWIESMVARVDPNSIVKAIEESGEFELTGLATDLGSQDVAAFKGLDIAKPITQEILTRVLSRGENLSDEKFIGRILRSALDLVASGGHVNDSLIVELSKTGSANIVEYPRRANIWDKLPGDAYENFISATGQGWLSKFARSDSDELPIERELESVVCKSSVLRDFLLGSEGKAASILVRFYRRFDNLNQDRFEGDLIAIQGNNRKINYIDSVSIGKLISDRGWSRSAGRLADDVLSYDRKDMIPAVNQFSHLLGYYDRARGWLSGKLEATEIHEVEWWEIFEETLSDLYPSGPQDDEIWSRAKGRKAVLDYNGKGFQRWHSALDDLRKGSGGKNISARKLLNETLKDYPENKYLNLLDGLAKRLRLD